MDCCNISRFAFFSCGVVYVRTRLLVGACRHAEAAVSTCCSFLFIYFATTDCERENVIYSRGTAGCFETSTDLSRVPLQTRCTTRMAPARIPL